MKRFLIAVLFCIISSLLAICVSAADVKPSVELDNGVEIKLTEDALFLPSCANPEKIKINFASDHKNITLTGKTVKSGDVIDITSFKTNDKNGNACYKVTFKTEDTSMPNDIVYFYIAETLPAVFINTSIGKNSVIDYNITDENALVLVTDEEGNVTLNEGGCEVRVRGNSTPTYAKKPFQMKFTEKRSLFGMGKAKTWLLLANYLDQSYIRNSVMYRLAKMLGMGAMDFRNVDFYVDGEYQGVYLLCEKVNINKNRVNITELEDLNDELNPTYGESEVVTSGALIDSTIISEYKYVKNVVNPEDITGGYLIELDNNNWNNRAQFGSYFAITTSFRTNLYVIKSPEYCSKEQVEYIATLFAEMEEAMASSNGKNSLGKHYSEYIDMDSFAYGYIMAELGRNYDAGGASIYFNKDIDVDGKTAKIVKGPLWDCDNVLGNIHRGGAEVQTNMWASNRTPWNMLTQHSDFNALVKEHFETLYDIIYDMLDYGGFIDEQIADIGNSATMDRSRWKLASSSSWPLYSNGDVHWFQLNGNAFPTYSKYSDGVNDTKSTAIGYLCLTLMERTEYLADVWNCDVTQRTRVLSTDIPQPEPPIEDEEPQEPTPPPQEESSSSSELESEKMTETESEIQTETETETETEITTETESEIQTETESEAQTESESESEQEDEKKNIFQIIIEAIVNFFKRIIAWFTGEE